ncbi:extracellular solute-binding protein [Thiospirochaeta perfilievii]|uniref:Extracellular solute-binding protein n=1 Tax=Thiospirochaeta perfilievii TaxID=252967 RepID=A0A5C1Q8S8_9SPIO|nr:extracellular solute-binding protein [Thiospirochaeta perfilievii]QEN03450.1 extracellular solute-binding protein [Thiospirochaeta perfilievii]
MNSKKILSIITLLVVMLLLVACDSGKKKKESMEDKVVVYSTHGEAMLELVAEAFEEETGIKVEFINLKGELADRIRAEKENPQSDVMFGGASSIFMELREEGIFDAYEPTWGNKLDPLFKDSENYWFGTIQTPVMLFYNSDVITKADAPTDWADLTKDIFKDQLVFRNALSSSARATYSALLQQFEMDGDLASGWDFMKAMDQNTKKYYGSGSLMFQALGRKEASVSFATLNSIIDNKVKNGLPLEVVNATIGSPIITDGIALIKDAKHPNAGKSFIDFAGSAKVQSMLAVEFNRMPTNPDALATSPKWMGEIKINPMDVNWADLAGKQSAWMQQWDTNIKDSKKDTK